MSSPFRRLRVLLVIDNAGAYGGAERFVAGLAHHFPAERIEPWVCSTRHGESEAVHALARAGIPHIDIGRSAKWDVYRLAKLVSLVRREDFDILHAHKFGSNLWGTLIGRACGVPVVIAQEHTWSYTGDPLRVWIDGHVIGRLATRLVAVSSADAQRMVSVEGVPPGKIVVMPTAYIPNSGASQVDIRDQLGISAGAPVVFVAAQLRRQKALEVMLDAHARLLGQVPDAHLVIAGEGPRRGELELQIQRLGIGPSVHLLGLRRDVDAILRDSTVAALSSDFEGLPLFVFEAMATNTPLVATSVGGLPEIVRDGSTGLLVPARDAQALGDALASLLSDPDRAGRLAAAAGDRLERFTIDAVAARYADFYAELLSEGQKR